KPCIIFLNVSDLAYATVKAVPSKVITPIVIPTGPVRAANPNFSQLNNPPAFAIEAVTGVIVLKTPPKNIRNEPPATSSGPIAAATAPNITPNVLTLGDRLFSHCMPSSILSDTLLNAGYNDT